MPCHLPTSITPGHIGLNVSDIERSTRFYREVFGFDLLRQSADTARPFAFLGREGAVMVTLWQQGGGIFPTDRPGLHHLAFKVESVEQVSQAEARLRALGARIHHDGLVPHSEGADSGGVFFEDPDGIRLEIFAPTGLLGAHAPHADAPTCGFF